MKLTMTMFACLMLTGCGGKNFQYPDPNEQRADFALSYAESLPGVAVNLDGYRN